jgi:hypothetical protein
MANIAADAEFGIPTVLWRWGPRSVRDVHEALARSGKCRLCTKKGRKSR